MVKYGNFIEVVKVSAKLTKKIRYFLLKKPNDFACFLNVEMI